MLFNTIGLKQSYPVVGVMVTSWHTGRMKPFVSFSDAHAVKLERQKHVWQMQHPHGVQLRLNPSMSKLSPYCFLFLNSLSACWRYMILVISQEEEILQAYIWLMWLPCTKLLLHEHTPTHKTPAPCFRACRSHLPNAWFRWTSKAVSLLGVRIAFGPVHAGWIKAVAVDSQAAPKYRWYFVCTSCFLSFKIVVSSCPE